MPIGNHTRFLSSSGTDYKKDDIAARFNFIPRWNFGSREDAFPSEWNDRNESEQMKCDIYDDGAAAVNATTSVKFISFRFIS